MNGARERAERAVVRAALALPPAVKRQVAGTPIRRDGHELELDTHVLLRLEEASPRDSLGLGDVGRMRADTRHSARVAAGALAPMSRVERLLVAGAEGPLEARLYVPAEAEGPEPGPLLVYFHGGGWVVGDLDTHDAPCRALARASGARVVAVDYRLAPEHPFPAPVDDALAAFGDLAARAASLGCDPARVAVGGDSAGGHLAAVVARHAEAAAQLLLYPVCDLAEAHPSRRTFAEGFFLTAETMAFYEASFAPPGTDLRDGRVSPLHAPDLAGVAPAIVITAGFDILRDEGAAYARRLHEAGVRTVYRCHDGFVHGFANALAARGPREAVAEAGGALRALLSA
ncbi:MAG: alpha/beta hydrolase fold domain-containing protein [Solirubrobacteraceae bacterium]